MDLELIRGCNVVKITQLKYRGFCSFSWELISHHKDVLLVRLLVSIVSPLHNFHIPLSRRIPSKRCNFSPVSASPSLCLCCLCASSARAARCVSQCKRQPRHFISWIRIYKKSHSWNQEPPKPILCPVRHGRLLQGNPPAPSVRSVTTTRESKSPC